MKDLLDSFGVPTFVGRGEDLSQRELAMQGLQNVAWQRLDDVPDIYIFFGWNHCKLIFGCPLQICPYIVCLYIVSIYYLW